MPPPASSPTMQAHWQKAWKTSRWSIFPASHWRSCGWQGEQALIAALKNGRGPTVRPSRSTTHRPDPHAALMKAYTAKAAIAAAPCRSPTSRCRPFPTEQALYGDKDPAADGHAACLEMGVTEVVVKDGENPCLVVSQHGQATILALTIKAVDTTGAADSLQWLAIWPGVCVACHRQPRRPRRTRWQLRSCRFVARLRRSRRCARLLRKPGVAP